MRILAVLTLVCALGLSAPAFAQEPAKPVVAAEFAESFPALLPMSPTTGSNATASQGLGLDETALIPATYWLLIGGLALRRVTRRRETPATPVSGRSLGPALPVPARS